MGEPILPYGGALWVIRIVLLVAIVAHIYSAVDAVAAGSEGPRRHLALRQQQGARRACSARYASFTLRWGGIIILLFVIYHLLHLTWNVVAPGGASDSPYERLVNGFQIWWLVLVYTIAMLAVGFHLRHGVWSALTTPRRQHQRRRPGGGSTSSPTWSRSWSPLASCSFPSRSCSEWSADE